MVTSTYLDEKIFVGVDVSNPNTDQYPLTATNTVALTDSIAFTL